MPKPRSGDDYTVLVKELSALGDTVQRLIRIHSPNGHGLCTACTTPGTGTARVPHPCPIRALADLAALSTDRESTS